MNNLTIEEHARLLFIAMFLLGLVTGAAISSTVHAYQESRKKKLDRFRNNWE